MKQLPVTKSLLTMNVCISALVITAIIVLYWFYQPAEPELIAEISDEIIEEPVRPSFDFNGMRCTTLRQDPIFTYDVKRQSVTLQVECAPELMLHYFQAEVVDNE